MKRSCPTLVAALAVILLSPLAVGLMAAPAAAQPGHCPPGLAKKNPPCVPPGQARRRGDDRYGDRYDDDHRHRDGDRYDSRYRDDDRSDRIEDAYRQGYRDGYRVAAGDRLAPGDYRLIEDPRRYGLNPYGREDSWRYYLVRDMLVRADPDTRRVLSVIGLAQALLR